MPAADKLRTNGKGYAYFSIYINVASQAPGESCRYEILYVFDAVKGPVPGSGNGNTTGGNLGSGNTKGGHPGTGNTAGGNTGTGNTAGGNPGSGNTAGGNPGTGNTTGGNSGSGIDHMSKRTSLPNGGGNRINPDELSPRSKRTSGPTAGIDNNTPRGGGSGQPGSAMVLEAARRTVVSGQTVMIPVWLYNGTGLADMNFDVDFDPAVAQVDGNAIRGNLLGDSRLESNSSETGKVLLGIVPSSGGVRDSAGTVVQIPFRANGPPGSRTTLVLTVRKFSMDGAGAQIAVINGETKGSLQEEVTTESKVREPGRLFLLSSAGASGTVSGDGVLAFVVFRVKGTEGQTSELTIEEANAWYDEKPDMETLSMLVRTKTGRFTVNGVATPDWPWIAVGAGALTLIVGILFARMMKRRRPDGSKPSGEAKVNLPKACHQCRAPLSDKAKFCPECGTPVREEPAQQCCAKCGAEINNGARFCHECGEPTGTSVPSKTN